MFLKMVKSAMFCYVRVFVFLLRFRSRVNFLWVKLVLKICLK